MKKVIVRFKSDNSNRKYDEIIINVSYSYEEAKKILQVANRKLCNKYKGKYICIVYVYSNQDQIIYTNYLR